MAITITDLRTTRNQADTAGGWTGTTTTGSSNPTPIEANGWLGANVGVEIFDSYFSAAAVDLSNAVVYCWVFSRLALGAQADTNGGLMVLLADATPDRIAFKVAGSDRAAFRHDNGPVGWQCPALDTQNLPASPVVRAGASANLDLANITAVGTCVNSLSTAPGMDPTYYVDIIRYLFVANNNGCAADIIGGASGGTEGKWSEIAAADRSVGNLQAHGLVRQLATGAFGVQGPLRFGNATGSASSWFEDSNVTVVFESRGFRTDLYKIFITDNGTGTTTFRLHSCALIAPPGVGAEFDADTDTDVTDVVIDQGSRISGFLGGVGLQSGHTVTDTIITGSGQVRANGATMNGSSVLQSTVTANNSALEWNVNTDPDGLLDDMTFDKTSGVAHHAIEFGTAISSGVSFTLNNCAFGTDFSGTEGGTTGDETFHFLDTTGTITLNLVGCTGNFGYRTEGVTVTIVVDPVTTLVNVKDTLKNNIQNARVFLETAATASGGEMFEAAVTSLTQSGGTATCTTTGVHKLATNDWVVIRGAQPDGYNKVTQVTVSSTTIFTYTVPSGISSPATGTPVVSLVPLHGLTDASGNISSSKTWSIAQDLKGWARKKNTSSPFYKDADIAYTVNITAGNTTNVVLQPDE